MKTASASPQPFVLDPKSAGDLRAKLKQDPQAGLKQVAQQFEGLLLQMMLKSMRDASPQDGLLDSDQSRFFSSIMDQQLAQNLSAQGKLGFAKLIEQQLGRNLQTGSATPSASSTTSALDALQQSLVARQTANLAAPSVSPVAVARPAKAPQEASADLLPAKASASKPGSSSDFVNRVWPHAREAAAATGVPAQFLVAHAALESGWGKREIRSANGSPTYNLFGVKPGSNWQGPTADAQTTEFVNGTAQVSREKFRVYSSYAEAFRDYASLLGSNSRFAGVLGQQNGAEFAKSLQKSGYATDPMYADKLSRIISGTTLRQALLA
jgi:flagellar protein FlgJ